MTVARAVLELRSTLNLSAEALGDELGVTKQAIYSWESGSTPRSVHLVRLSAFARRSKAPREVIDAFEGAIGANEAHT